MQSLIDLTKGREIVEPYLVEHGFKFEGYDYIKKSGGLLTEAIYQNTGKKVIICFHYSIQNVVYQFNSSVVNHHFYLDKLGFADDKRFPDFQFDDKLLSFENILHDFKYLEDDFFKGSCAKLEQFAKLRDELIKAQEKFENKYDAIKIEQAQKEFVKKEFDNCLELYQSVEHTELLNDFDNKLVEFCVQHIKLLRT